MNLNSSFELLTSQKHQESDVLLTNPSQPTTKKISKMTVLYAVLLCLALVIVYGRFPLIKIHSSVPNH